MSWNYRVVKVVYGLGTDNEQTNLEIREVYYNKDGSIWAISEEAASVGTGEELEDLNQVLSWMKASLEKDIIDLDAIEFASPDYENIDELEFENTYPVELGNFSKLD